MGPAFEFLTDLLRWSNHGGFGRQTIGYPLTDALSVSRESLRCEDRGDGTLRLG